MSSKTLEVGQVAGTGDVSGDPRRWRILAVASVAQFLAILDLFAVNVAFPALQRSFGDAPLSQVTWVLNAYTIVLAALLVPAGRLADVIGRRKGFLLGLALFGLASVGCALAPALPVLIAARVVQSASGAMLIPTALALVLPAFPQQQKPIAMSVWTLVAGAGAGSGPVVGGLLAQVDWRLLFLVNVPVTLIAVVAGLRVLPNPRSGVRRRLDLPGAGLILATTALLVTAFVQAPAWGYASARTLGCALAAVLLGGVLARHATRGTDPIISLALLRRRMFGMALAGIFCYYLSFGAMLLSATLLFTTRWHYSAIEAGFGVLPGPLTVIATTLLMGRAIRRFGPRPIAVIGGLTMAAGCAWWAVMATASPDYLKVWLPGMILAGLSTATLQPALFGAASTLPPSELALGSALLMMARQIGTAVGVAILAAILGAAGHPSIGELRTGWWYMAVAALLAAAASLRVKE
jgi:EmrB/QacA subfamily drug resistance transporter